MSSILKITATLLAVLALGVGAIGCGGGDDSNDSGDPAAQGEDFTKCLQENGVKAPSGDGAPTFDPSKLQQALEKCREKLPESAPSPTPVTPPGE